MNKATIIKKLSSNHQEFIGLVLSLNEKDFISSVNNKWTAGQHVEHIYLSVSPVTKALKLPVFFLRLLFGKANRPSKDYDALVKKYHNKLEKGGVAPGRFVPKPVSFEQREQLARKLSGTVTQLCKAANRYTESKLDHYIMPHPLLGKVTVREMLYFTIYHVEHHKRSMLQNVGRPL